VTHHFALRQTLRRLVRGFQDCYEALAIAAEPHASDRSRSIL